MGTERENDRTTAVASERGAIGDENNRPDEQPPFQFSLSGKKKNILFRAGGAPALLFLT